MIARRVKAAIASAIEHFARGQASKPGPAEGLPARLLARRLQRSGLFDAYAYAAGANLTGLSETELIRHYLARAPRERAPPQPRFDAERYRGLARLPPDVDPFLHFTAHHRRHEDGLAEGFDVGAYRRDNPDIRLTDWDATRHYVERGWREGRSAPPPPVPALPDFTGLGGRVEASPASLDIIMPAYRGRAETLVAIHRVLSAKTAVSFRLLVIDDASPEPELSRDLAALEQRRLIIRKANSANLGFTVTVNRGMRWAGERDVVLLNSDTEVYDHWLDRLWAHAHGSSDVGSVTPMSNAATILSYPIRLRDNHAALELPYPELAALAGRLAPAPVEIPTGVGFCLYLRRACLNAVGPFDEHAFPRGYGEENDFCLRATKLGWRHLAATDTFVRHLGSRSFGSEKLDLVARGLEVLDGRHPGYGRLIDDFIRSDPLAEVRADLDLARVQLIKPSGRLTHGFVQRELALGDLVLRRVAGRPDLFHVHSPSAPNTPNLPELNPAGDPGATGRWLERLNLKEIALRECPMFGQRQAAALKNSALATGMIFREG